MWQQFAVNGLVAGSALGLLAASFAFIHQTARFFHFAHASMYTLAAYLAYALARSLQVPLALAIVGAVVLTAVFGWLQYAVVYAPIARREASPSSLLLVSIGLMVAIQNSIAMFFGDELKILWERPVGRGMKFGAALITPIQLWTIGSSIVALISLGAFLTYTRLGVRLRATADDPEFALAAGLRPDSIVSGAFAVGSALAAIAAVLASLDTGLTPSMGFNALLMAVAAVVVGGSGSIVGALLGGLLIGLIRNLAVVAIATTWVDPIVFVVLIVFLLVRPNGLMGVAEARR